MDEWKEIDAENIRLTWVRSCKCGSAPEDTNLMDLVEEGTAPCCGKCGWYYILEKVSVKMEK